MAGSLSLTLFLLFGLVLGLLFYGGLWLTVRALPRSGHPVVLALASFWGRTGLVLAGFVATAHRWQNAALCLVGFVIARVLLARSIPGRKATGGTVV